MKEWFQNALFGGVMGAIWGFTLIFTVGEWWSASKATTKCLESSAPDSFVRAATACRARGGYVQVRQYEHEVPSMACVVTTEEVIHP